MKNKKYYLVLLVLFFFSVPLFQSLFFSATNSGVLYINKKIDANFLHSDKKNLLVYFGYVGCADVCTPFLSKLSQLYESQAFTKLQKETDIFFVNLTPNIEPEQAEMFAKAFHKDFNGVYLSKQELLKLDRTFDLFFSDALTETTELNHTDYLYLLENHKGIMLLKSIYFTHPLREQQLINDMISKK